MEPYAEAVRHSMSQPGEQVYRETLPEQFEFADVTVQFTTIHIPDAQKPFGYFAGVNIPEDSEEYEITISDDVPEELRGLWAWHEYNNLHSSSVTTRNYRLQAERFICEQLGDTELYEIYRAHRIPFYQSLAHYMAKEAFAKDGVSEHDSMDIQACYAAMDFLDK